jgi:hypothetical protein
MISGRITRCGDRYEVIVPGGEIYVKAAEVQQHCRNVQEAYHRKKALIRCDNVLDHLELSQWCMKAGLLDPASRELAEAAALDPRHPLIPVLERRLKVASAPPPKAEPGDKSSRVGPTTQELDRMVRGMPPKTVEIFAQVIQPMLVNNCSAAACHGQSVRNGFRLLRVPVDSPPSRLLTQRNLHAALQWLDRDNPEASPLLRYTTQAHGAARVPIFTDRQVVQFRQLRDWCYRVTQTESPVVQASYNEPAGSSTQGHSGSRSSPGGTRGTHRQHPASGMEPSQKTSPLAAWDSGTVDLRNSSGPDGQRRTVQRGGAVQKSSAADPCDAESFNRQYATPGRAQNGAKPSQPGQPRDATGPAANGDEYPPSETTPPPGRHAGE